MFGGEGETNRANAMHLHAFVNKSRRSLVYHPQPVAAYHQCEALHIIKPQGKCTLTRDEIQGRRAALDDIRRTSRGDDMPSLRLG
ncbi:MAG: hypothetical protein E7624_07170 [Ruminococcaceae bacterium]|nr:hypothetical protein [Oscillospiraceae bacterium]